MRLIGVLGELLITVGLLAGLFLAWQLWWTDVIAHREQEARVAEIEEIFSVPEASEPAPEEEPAPPQPSADEPPEIAAPAENEVFGIIRIPRFAATYAVPVAEGVGVQGVLNAGNIGHYPSTVMPGQVGNFATAAHRQSYGAPYRQIEELQEGDDVIVETAEGWFVYRVYDHYVVYPEDVQVIAPVPGDPAATPERRLITLTTCHPLFSAAQRWITHGELVEWYPRAGGAPTRLWETP